MRKNWTESTRKEKRHRLATMQEDIRRGFIPVFADMPPVPKMGGRDAGQLPPPPDYKPPYVPPDTVDVEAPLLAAPEKLKELLRKSLDAADRILSIVPDPSQPEYLKMVSLQATVLQAVLSTQARVDETRLRGAVQDRFGELMERLQASRKPDVTLVSSPNGQHAPGPPPESPT